MSAVDALGWSSELIVCDNNSSDRTAGIARAAGATVVFEPVNQISRARNVWYDGRRQRSRG
jgi:glycosyltransferase involved in cell wall biosynthesis